jgi:hypothetical protein
MGPEAYRIPAEFAATFRRAMPMCAGVLVLGAVIAWTTVRRPAPTACHPECRVQCGVGAPALEPSRDAAADGSAP